MIDSKKSNRERARSIARSRVGGYGLNRECYFDADLYRLEMDGIWRRGWIFVGHSCDVLETGDCFTFEIDGDPLVVVRQHDGTVKAFHNVCRHRGSIVVVEDQGHHGHLTCPYHQWTYRLDGSLLRGQGAPNEIPATAIGLRPIATEEVAGLIFVCLDQHPRPFDDARGELLNALSIQGLDQAKVAKYVDYEVPANWKLVWENNRECLHCVGNHPQYVKANFDAVAPGDNRYDEKFAAAREQSLAGLADSGVSAGVYSGYGLVEFPDPTGSRWWSINRTALREGFRSESVDGALVAPLMGGYTNSEVGTLRMRTLPNFWCHASCDHAVTTRLTPSGLASTKIRVSWLVDASAKEGIDYEIEKLLPFWQLTSEQDWTICERQQRGIGSSAFVPGPLSPTMEANVDRFLTWYTTTVIALSES